MLVIFVGCYLAALADKGTAPQVRQAENKIELRGKMWSMKKGLVK